MSDIEALVAENQRLKEQLANAPEWVDGTIGPEDYGWYLVLAEEYEREILGLFLDGEWFSSESDKPITVLKWLNLKDNYPDLHNDTSDVGFDG